MKKNSKIILNFALSIIITAFIYTFSIILVVNFKPLYYFDIKYLNIPKNSNLSEAAIKNNYNYIIYFFKNSKMLQFKLPDLKSSKNGIQHFIEVKNIIKYINYIFVISFAISISGILLCIKYKNYIVLKLSSFSIFILSILLSMPFIINFNKAFVLFHKTLFNNNYWVFSPYNDPIINILPETFFFHCALLMFGLILIFCLILLVIYHYLVKISVKK